MKTLNLRVIFLIFLVYFYPNVCGQNCKFIESAEFWRLGYTCKIDFNETVEIHLLNKNDNDVINLEFDGLWSSDEFSNLNFTICDRFENLESIHVEKVKFESINANLINSCLNLKNLDLENNEIKMIPEHLFSKNSNLEVLNLKHNKLKTLPELVFLNQRKLTSLKLNNNAISALPVNIFESLLNLQELSLRSNRIEVINSEWFKNLQKLKLLELNFNHISTLSSKNFKPLVSLETLYLGNNKIQSLNPNCFEDLKSLKSLDLSNNEIVNILIGTFDHLKNLEILWMSNNKLKTVHADSFRFQQKLILVNFANNSISSIKENFIEYTALSSIDIRNNECCSKWIQRKTQIKEHLARCFKNYETIVQHQKKFKSLLKDKITTPIPSAATESTTRIYQYATLPTKYFRTTEMSQKIFEDANERQITPKVMNQNPKIEHLSKTCGKRKFKHKGIGGTQALIGSYPWNAALTKPDGTFFCGAVVIDSKHVVTAAHCIKGKQNSHNFKASDIVVVIGAFDLKQNESHQVIVPVKSIHVHPDWNPVVLSYDADIAILKLAKEVEFNMYIQPICLIEPNSNLSSLVDGEVVGFGRSEHNNHESIAQIIETPIQSNEKCIKSRSHEYLLSHRAFCGGYANGTGVCLGDSGSGLFVFQKGIFYLRGIVSASLRGGLYGCDVNTYAVFTNVIKFYSWIKSDGQYDAETRVQQLEAEIRELRQQLKDNECKNSEGS